MPECCITDCKSGRIKISRKKRAKNPEPEIVQSFPFPTETTARNRWLRQCGLGENLPQSARICAKHFLESCFLSQSENVDEYGRPRAKLRLKDDAFPTVFSFGPAPSPSKRARPEMSFADFGGTYFNLDFSAFHISALT